MGDQKFYIKELMGEGVPMLAGWQEVIWNRMAVAPQSLKGDVMKLEIHRNSLKIIPEDKSAIRCDERDTAYIEEVLGLKKDGDSIKLVRKNAYGLSCIAYLETKKEDWFDTPTPKII